MADALDRIGGWLEAIVEGSIAVPPHNVPEPDIVVTDAAEGEGLIPLESVALIVETADTSLSFDLGTKARVYAGASIPEYWVVDVKARSIHQFWRPDAGAYAERREVAFGESLSAATIAKLTIETATL